MKQQKLSENDFTKEDLEAIRKVQARERVGDLVLLFLALLAGFVVIVCAVEIL